ncbi:hypothetical protein [Pseudorhodoplanes sp.]|uniref:hypothetical protein n=1 Tax=Pseudorhodoplanes sp. TaxID=1934341 RepID=UPI002B771F69|nr:hypothetical protein [Pseudorhodoplanes sp.]HWV43390.1 hypothetical protein [Pseudorhodoplanes sp.]
MHIVAATYPHAEHDPFNRALLFDHYADRHSSAAILAADFKNPRSHNCLANWQVFTRVKMREGMDLGLDRAATGERYPQPFTCPQLGIKRQPPCALSLSSL